MSYLSFVFVQLEVVKQNYIAPKSGKEYLVFTKIDHVAFNDDGSWLATVSYHQAILICLGIYIGKLWQF